MKKSTKIALGIGAAVIVVGVAVTPAPDDSPVGGESVPSEVSATLPPATTATPTTTAAPTTIPTTTVLVPDELHPSILWLVDAVGRPEWAEIAHVLDELQLAADNENSVAVAAASAQLSERFYALFYDAPIGDDSIGVTVEDAMLDCAIAYEVLGEGWSTMDADYILYGIELQDDCGASITELTDLMADAAA